MKRTAKAHWTGNLKEGKGTLTTQSNILNQANYSFKLRFEEGLTGTNPEELIAAAHSGCFTMAVSSILSQKGFNPTSLDTVATITLENGVITNSHLAITGRVPGLSAGEFETVTKDAEKNCIVSKALNFSITSEAKFLGD